jgi:hypothetical protein
MNYNLQSLIDIKQKRLNYNSITVLFFCYFRLIYFRIKTYNFCGPNLQQSSKSLMK